jgi:regulator of replication initiation timing
MNKHDERLKSLKENMSDESIKLFFEEQNKEKQKRDDELNTFFISTRFQDIYNSYLNNSDIIENESEGYSLIESITLKNTELKPNNFYLYRESFDYKYLIYKEMIVESCYGKFRQFIFKNDENYEKIISMSKTVFSTIKIISSLKNSISNSVFVSRISKIELEYLKKELDLFNSDFDKPLEYYTDYHTEKSNDTLERLLLWTPYLVLR